MKPSTSTTKYHQCLAYYEYIISVQCNEDCWRQVAPTFTDHPPILTVLFYIRVSFENKFNSIQRDVFFQSHIGHSSSLASWLLCSASAIAVVYGKCVNE